MITVKPKAKSAKKSSKSPTGFGAETGFRICALLLSGFWPANAARIAEHLNLAEPYVRRVLETLVDRGYLVRGQTTNTTTGVRQNVYGVAGFEFRSKVIQAELTFLAPNYRSQASQRAVRGGRK